MAIIFTYLLPLLPEAVNEMKRTTDGSFHCQLENMFDAERLLLIAEPGI